jgi:hypothetical protein
MDISRILTQPLWHIVRQQHDKASLAQYTLFKADASQQFILSYTQSKLTYRIVLISLNGSFSSAFMRLHFALISTVCIHHCRISLLLISP